MSSVKDQRLRWCEQDHAIVSVESSTSSDQQQRRPDVRRNSVDCDGTTSWWLAAERRCCLDSVAETGTQWAARYWGAVPSSMRNLLFPLLSKSWRRQWLAVMSAKSSFTISGHWRAVSHGHRASLRVGEPIGHRRHGPAFKSTHFGPPPPPPLGVSRRIRKCGWWK